MGRLKDALMDIQQEVYDLEGREIEFEEAGKILAQRFAVAPGKVSVINLPVGGKTKVKSLGKSGPQEFKFELLQENASLKAGAHVVLQSAEIQNGLIEILPGESA